MTKNMGVVGFFLISMISSPAANALTTTDKADFYAIGSSKIQEVTPAAQVLANLAGGSSGSADITSVLDPITQIINVGKEVWPIIEANKPVANIQEADVASAVPSANWQQLAGWSAPQRHTFNVPYKNKFGMTIVNFTFDVIYTYGGNLNGAGHYLSGVTVVPSDLAVQWGFTFNADVKVINVTNAGSVTDPLAAMQVQMHWSVSSVMTHDESTDNFYIRGDGQFSQI
jgi:hypothetical protein